MYLFLYFSTNCVAELFNYSPPGHKHTHTHTQNKINKMMMTMNLAKKKLLDDIFYYVVWFNFQFTKDFFVSTYLDLFFLRLSLSFMYILASLFYLVTRHDLIVLFSVLFRFQLNNNHNNNKIIIIKINKIKNK